MSLRFSLSTVFQVLVLRKVFLTTKYKFLIFESAKGGDVENERRARERKCFVIK